MDCSLVPRRFRLGPCKTSIRSMIQLIFTYDCEVCLAGGSAGRHCNRPPRSGQTIEMYWKFMSWGLWMPSDLAAGVQWNAAMLRVAQLSRPFGMVLSAPLLSPVEHREPAHSRSDGRSHEAPVP